MSNEAVGCDILLRGVPGDVVQELGRRAEVNFRSRMNEAIAILTAVCRSDATLPGLGVGETLPTIRGTEDLRRAEPASQDGDLRRAEPASQDGDLRRAEPANQDGGDV